MIGKSDIVGRIGVCLAALAFVAMAVGALRPLPQRATLADGPQRFVFDGAGNPVATSTQVREIAFFWAAGIGEFLLTTADPVHGRGAADQLDAYVSREPLLRRALPSLDRAKLDLPFRGPAGASVEFLLRERPSAVVAVPWAAAVFRPAGLSTFVMPIAGDEAAMLAETHMIAALDQKDQRGAQATASWHTVMRDIVQEIGPSPPVRPRVVEIVTQDLHFRALGSPLSESVIRAAGGLPALPGRRLTPLDAERLLALDPDVIVLRYPLAPEVASPRAFEALPWTAGLRAAATKRIYLRPPCTTLLCLDVVEWALIARWYAELLHPERTRPHLRALAASLYRTALGLTPSDADLDRILAIDANANSRHYERFRSAAPGVDPR